VKISIAPHPKEQGAVLAVTLCICAILAILIGSYLSLIRTQYRSVVRSDAWHEAMVTAEAGVEEAMAQLNSGVTTNDLGVNSWHAVGTGVFQKTNFLGDSYSVVTIRIYPAVTDPYPVILSRARVPGPVSGPPLYRTVQVRTRPRPVILTPGAMVVLSTVDFSGQGISADSFISSDTNYSSGGLYDPRKARDHGDVVTLSSATNAIQVGNAKIKGIIRTGPDGQASVGANGSVGDAGWVNGGQRGIQAGHFADDVNVEFPSVKLPPSFNGFPPPAGKYQVNGTTYKYSLNNSMNWQLSTLDGSVYVSGGDVVLYVTDNIKIGSGMQIRIATNSSLTVYMAGATTTISGQGIVNESGQAKNFTYYGLPSNKAVDFGANAAFVGSIYAPQAAFTLGGGGNNTYDFVGRCVTKSAKMNGHYNFHYDEVLETVAAPTGYIATSWDEL
jgi:hypothetical protein